MEKDNRPRLRHQQQQQHLEKHQQQRQQQQLQRGDLQPWRQHKVQLHRHVLCTVWSQQRPLSSPPLTVAVVAILVLLAVLGVRADAPQKEVLLTVKRDFKAQGMWNPLPSWIEETDPCENEWSGVTCDDLLRITQLNLQFSNLRGSIPEAIGQLTDLQELVLSTNYLTGRIPESIGSLTNLSRLALFNNRLHGQLPNFIGFMGQLQYLQLSHNNFTGKLPRNLGFLSKLTYLDMSQNALVGPIPRQLSALMNLQTLVAYSNNLTGALPDWIGDWTAINTLDLHENQLEGPIPETWANVDSLMEIILDNNRLTGTLPNGLGALPKLNKLLASRNQLEGSFPDSFSLLDNLELLDLSHNHGINGTIPGYFGSLSSLKSLNLEDCNLSGVLPMSIGQSVQLVELFLGENRLQGPIPEALSVLADLTRLMLDNNDLTGDFPSWICELSELRVLHVENNRLTGQIPQCLLSLRSIKSIDITGNYMSGVVPPNPQPSLTFLVDNNCFSNRDGQRSTCDPSQPKAPEPASFESPPPPPSSPNTPPPSPEPETPSMPPDGESPPSSETPQGGTSDTPPPSTQTTASTEPPPTDTNVGVSWTYLFLIFLVIFFFFFVGAVFMISNTESMATPFSSPNRSDQLAVMEYSLAKIKRATRNFTSVYGRGSFGTVYLAEDLRKDQVDPRAIIKRANDPSKMGEFLFKCKVEVLARARHRYLVNLIGYCVGKGERILIYEYLPNGTLFDRLHRPELEPLPWETRVKIAVNVACALEYLHHGVTPPLVHRAVTSSNILLAADMSAKLSDYGIARGTGGSAGAYDDTPARRRKSRASPSRDSSGGAPSDAASANAAGGAAAAASNDPSASPTRSEAGSERETLQPVAALEKVDVYGFGVVLLELITGQKAMKEVHITSVAAPFLEDPQMMPLMVDPQLGGYFNHSELVELGTIARDCVHDDPSQRPTMHEVLQAMEERLRLDTALFDNIDHDEVLSSADGYSAPAPTLGFGRRHTAAAAATGTGTNPLTPTWVAIESFTRSIRDALVSPHGMRRSGSSSGGALYQPGIPQSQSSEELEMSSLLMMSGSSSSSAVRQR